MKQKVYDELRDSLGEKTCDDFFHEIMPDDYMADEHLRDLILTVDSAYWKLADFLDRKTGH